MSVLQRRSNQASLALASLAAVAAVAAVDPSFALEAYRYLSSWLLLLLFVDGAFVWQLSRVPKEHEEGNFVGQRRRSEA